MSKSNLTYSLYIFISIILFSGILKGQNMVQIDLTTDLPGSILVPHDQFFSVQVKWDNTKKIKSEQIDKMELLFLQLDTKKIKKNNNKKNWEKEVVVSETLGKSHFELIKDNLYAISKAMFIARPFKHYAFEIRTSRKATSVEINNINQSLIDDGFVEVVLANLIEAVMHSDTPDDVWTDGYYDIYEKHLKNYLSSNFPDFYLDTVYIEKTFDQIQNLANTLSHFQGVIESEKNPKSKNGMMDFFSAESLQDQFEYSLKNTPFDSCNSCDFEYFETVWDKTIEVVKKNLPLSIIDGSIMLGASTIPIEESARLEKFFTLTPSLAYSLGPINQPFMGMGAQYHLRPMNRKTAISELKMNDDARILSHLTLNGGISLVNLNPNVFSENRRGLLNDQSIYLGAGYMIGEWFYVNAGAFYYNQNNPNPLIDKNKIGTAFYFAFNISTSARDYIKKGITPKIK